MAGYFILELDTTQPNIEIYAPKYTDRNSDNQIRVVSNEKLMEYQDIYIIDSQGVRHDVVLSFDGEKEYSGNVVFNDFPFGLSTIYAQLKDEVGNPSNLAVFHISLVTSHDSLMLRLALSESKTEHILGSIQAVNKLSEKQVVKTVTEKKQNVTLEEKSNKIRVSEKN